MAEFEPGEVVMFHGRPDVTGVVMDRPVLRGEVDCDVTGHMEPHQVVWVDTAALGPMLAYRHWLTLVP